MSNERLQLSDLFGTELPVTMNLADFDAAVGAFTVSHEEAASGLTIRDAAVQAVTVFVTGGKK